MDESRLGSFHHVGIAVRDIRASAAQYAALFGAVAESAIIRDPAQGVRVQFIRMGGLRVELVEPAEEASPLDSIIRRGIALYHVCHEVADLDGALDRMQTGGAKLVSAPKPAAAFGGRRVAFVMWQGLMVELLEAEAV